VKVYKFSVIFLSDLTDTSAHVTALWRFIVKFHPPATLCGGPEQAKLNFTVELLPTW